VWLDNVQSGRIRFRVVGLGSGGRIRARVVG
jgi:hypothetical protein